MSREPTSQETPVHFSIFIEKDLQQNPLVTFPSSLTWQVYKYIYKDNNIYRILSIDIVIEMIIYKYYHKDNNF